MSLSKADSSSTVNSTNRRFKATANSQSAWK
jgi:hypothetical protein